MIDCITEQSFLIFRWTFDRMLPSLPTPGTAAFGVLSKVLNPYGISPAGISLEAPTSWLADVSLRVRLLDSERGDLRLSYGHFEARVNYFSQGDDAKLLNILEGIFSTLREVDTDAMQGHAQIRWNGHLRFKTGDIDSFLRQHLPG